MRKEFQIPLFWKFAIAIVTIVILFGSINAYLIYHDIQSALERESEKRAMNIAKTLAEQSVTYLLFEDYVAVQKLLDEEKALDSTIVYSFIVDKKQKFIAGSYDLVITPALIRANQIKDGEKQSIVIIQMNDLLGRKKIRDIALPILGGELGYVRVGINEESINRYVYNAVSHFWFMVGFFLFVGIIGALIFALVITRPINTIRDKVGKLKLESLGETKDITIKIRQNFLGYFPILFRAKDEIDTLTEKFNEMLIRLQNAYIKLNDAQKKLIESEKLASIGTLSSGIAHEINNPISGIQNAIERIIENPDKVEQNKKYLFLVSDAIKRIENVVKGLLSFARREEYQFTSVNPREIIDELNVLIGPKLEKSKIIFEVNIDNRCEIYCSKNHIEQVLLNLCLNSIDSLNDVAKEEKIIKIKFYCDTLFSYISIFDNGQGIPHENLETIFEPFFTTKEKG
ncbi:MAG: HAMP domain-containing protein, partial [Ignavibacteria bacterium]